jgi:hypothetical protein
MAADARPVALANLEAHDPHAPAPQADGEQDFLCPLAACADHQNPAQHRSLSANVQTGLWQCHRCGGRGRLREYWEDRPRVARPRRLTLVTPTKLSENTQPCVFSDAAKPAVVSKRKVGGVRRFVCVAPDSRQAVHCRQNVVLTLADGGERPDKEMWWETPDGRRGLPEGLHTADLLYCPRPLRDGAAVVVCEGETATDAAIALGQNAVGVVCGASSTPSSGALAQLLRFEPVLSPDHDDQGHGLMRRIAHWLLEHGSAPRWLTIPDAAPKDDLADYQARGGTTDELAALIDTAPSAYSEVVAALKVELAATGDDDSARVQALEAERDEARQNYRETLAELLEAKRQTPERALDRFIDELAEMERHPRTRGMLLPTLVLLRDHRHAVAAGKGAAPRIPWRYAERQQQLQRAPHTQRKALDTLVAHHVIGQEYRDLGERGKADWRQELDLYFTVPLPDDLPDAVQMIRRRIHETAPEAKVVKRRGPCPACLTARCQQCDGAPVVKSVVIHCTACGGEVVRAHRHEAQPPSTQPVPAVVHLRPPLGDPYPSAREAEGKNCIQGPLEDVESKNCIQLSAPPDDHLVAAALAAFEQARAQHADANLSPAASVAAQLAALQAVATAAQAPPLPLAAGPPMEASSACRHCGKPTGGRLRCPPCHEAWVRGVAS